MQTVTVELDTLVTIAELDTSRKHRQTKHTMGFSLKDLPTPARLCVMLAHFRDKDAWITDSTLNEIVNITCRYWGYKGSPDAMLAMALL